MSHNKNTPDKDLHFLRNLVLTCKEHGYVIWEFVQGANTARRQRLLMAGFISFKGTSALKEVTTTPLAEAYIANKPAVTNEDAFILSFAPLYHIASNVNVDVSKVKVALVVLIGTKVKVVCQTPKPIIFLIVSGRSYIEDHFSLIQYTDQYGCNQEGWILTSSLVGAY